MTKAFEERETRATISMDSLERLDQMFYSGGILVNVEAFALQGLFRAAGQAGRSPTSPYQVRVSFPAELWHFYSDLSSNPLKDFDNSVVLHWDNSELLHVAATRFMKFLQIHEPIEFRGLKPTSAPWAQSLLQRYLPAEITNGLETVERTLPYLLRHTQLLPRHFIHLLNRVFSDYEFGAGHPTEQHIRESVADGEVAIVEAIIDGFRIPYPNLSELCTSLIPQLPHTFSEGDLHTAVNRANRYGLDYREITQMLVEVGAVGRMTERTRTYVKAEFEYLYPHRMFVTPEDTLCLHPLFSARFDSLGRHRPLQSGVLPIYPLGSSDSNEFSREISLSGGADQDSSHPDALDAYDPRRDISLHDRKWS
ncbi:MAG: hypothetical protein L0H96_12665 [Humibacillus sp.]|nr:hypothetical protein [Humibacillus sp.]MDN5777758.1 hypothetical protein [Humibacillus sp.]